MFLHVVRDYMHSGSKFENFEQRGLFALVGVVTISVRKIVKSRALCDSRLGAGVKTGNKGNGVPGR